MTITFFPIALLLLIRDRRAEDFPANIGPIIISSDIFLRCLLLLKAIAELKLQILRFLLVRDFFCFLLFWTLRVLPCDLAEPHVRTYFTPFQILLHTPLFCIDSNLLEYLFTYLWYVDLPPSFPASAARFALCWYFAISLSKYLCSFADIYLLKRNNLRIKDKIDSSSTV